MSKRRLPIDVMTAKRKDMANEVGGKIIKGILCSVCVGCTVYIFLITKSGFLFVVWFLMLIGTLDAWRNKNAEMP